MVQFSTICVICVANCRKSYQKRNMQKEKQTNLFGFNDSNGGMIQYDCSIRDINCWSHRLIDTEDT